MRSIVLSTLILLASTSAYPQEMPKGEHFIEVTGTAHKEIEPNEIFLQIKLREFEENREKTSLEKLDKNFLEAVKAAAIDRKRLELSNVGSQLGKLGRKDKDAFREKTYQLKLTSGAELEKFLEKLEPVKVDRVIISKLSHSDLEKIKMELTVAALQVARTKAETLAKSIGSEIGKPITIREWEQHPLPYMEMNANVMMRNKEADFAGDAVGEEPTPFRKIRLQAQVMAQFEVK